jgi:hypothetical protein
MIDAKEFKKVMKPNVRKSNFEFTANQPRRVHDSLVWGMFLWSQVHFILGVSACLLERI